MPDSQSSPAFDLDLQSSDVQDLTHPGAIAEFFDRLGYRTARRTPVPPAQLGITAEKLLRAIRSIELLAEGEDDFQVYLFDLQSVTVAHLQALARVFRNRVGSFLLVLPGDRDYSAIDLVFLEEVLASRQAPSTPSLAAPTAQSKRKPRVLTVDRRNPTPVQLRVLRRFTWTESDGFFQTDKILAAYAIADWSEELLGLASNPGYTMDARPADPV